MHLVNSVSNGTESISFLGSKMWDMLHDEIKEMKTMQPFKGAIKKESRKFSEWTLQVLFDWSRIYLIHTCNVRNIILY